MFSQPQQLAKQFIAPSDGPSSARIEGAIPPWTPHYGPQSAQPQFSYAQLPFSSNNPQLPFSSTAQPYSATAQSSPRIRASFSQPSPLSSVETFTSKDIPVFNQTVQVVDVDGKSSPPPSWEWGSQGISKKQPPVLTPLQQLSFASWKARGPASAGVEPMQLDRSWIGLCLL